MLAFDEDGSEISLTPPKEEKPSRVTQSVNEDLEPEKRALLDTIAGGEAPGYDAMYTGSGSVRRFNDFSDHPRSGDRITSGPNLGKVSRAAGRYQFTPATWDQQAKKLGLPNFRPEHQDRAAADLAESTYGKHMLDALRTGDPQRIASVGRGLNTQWTSLPGGPESSMRDDDFVRRYQQNLSKYKASSQSQESIPKIGFTDDEVEAIEPVAVPETAPTPAPHAAATPEWSDYAKQYAAGVADIPKTIAAGADLLGADKFANYLREGAKSYEEDWRNQMTSAGREAADKPLLDENNNIQNLRAIPMAAASSIPGMIAMGGAGKAVGSGLKFLGTTEKLAPLIEKIPGINPEVAKKVADWTANGIAYGGAEGVYSGLSNAEQKRDEIINTPLETLAKNPTFQEALRSEPKTGNSIDRAKRVREKLASLAMEDTFLKTAASTGAIGALTGGGIFGQLESRIGKTAAGQIALDTLLESGQEALQSGGESIISNKVTQQYGDPNRGTFEGTVNDIATGAATGGLLGGVGGAGGVLGGRNEQPISQPSVSGETNGQDANVSNPGNEGREGIPSETQTGRQGGEGRVQGEQESTDSISPTNATSETQQAPVKVGEKPASKGYTMLPSREGIQIVDDDGNVVSTHPQITDAIEAFDQLHADNTQAQTPTDQETSNELQATTAPSGQVGQLQDQASRGQQASEGAEQGSRQEAVQEGHHGLELPAQGQVNLGDQTSGQLPEGTTNADRPTGNAGEDVSGSATSLQSAAGGEQGAGVPPGGNRRGSRSGGTAANVQVSPTETGPVSSDRVTSRPLTAKEEGELRGHNTVLKKLGKPAMTPEQYLAEQSAKLQTAASNRNVTDQEVVDAYNSAVGRHNQRAVEENRRIDAAGTGESKKILRSNVRAATTLPSSGSLQRRTAESIAKIFGHKIIYVESADGKPLDIDGSIVGSHPNHILLAADSKQSLSRVAVHEMVHGLRRNSPEIYGQLVRNLREHYNPLAVAKHLEDRGYDSELPSFSDNPEVFSDENRSEEEWVSDHVSDIIHHPESIQQLAERMEGQKTGSGRAFLNHVKDFIDSLISKLRGEGFGTESAVARKHLKKSREAVVEALAKYHAHQQGGGTTRAGEEIVDSKRSATSQEQVRQAEFPDEIRTTAGLDNALKIAKGQVWRKGRDLKQTIQDAVMKIAGKSGVKPNEFNSEETFDYLKKVAKDDVLFALKQNPNAVGWYDEKTHQALALMALVHPEIKKNQDARFAFVWALAVTSNGMKVDKNFELAEKAYEVYKKTGRMPTNIRAGQAQKAINQSLKLFNDLRDQWGMDDLRRFMLTDFKVSEIAGIDSALKPGGEHVDVTVKGASILGPKIGNGFFSNLYGNFDSLTMDRWLIRTWGRWTGTLIAPMPEQTANARSRLSQVLKSAVNDSHVQRVFEEAVGHPLTQGADVDTLAGEIQKASMDPDFRNELSKTEIGNELRKAGNGLAKYLDGQKEAPYGPQERKDIRKVFQSVLDELNETEEYKDLTMADMQAVLWYAEKRLYESAKEDFADDSDETEGYTDDEAPDYANAAAAIARSKGISDKKIKATLKRESNDGRSRTTRSRNAEEGLQQTQVGQQEEARGFTASEKRTFLRTRAVHRIRSNRQLHGEESWSYERKSRRTGGKPGVLKNLGVTAEADWRLKQKSKNALKNSGPISFSPFLELVQGDPANAQKFADYITSFKQSIGKDGAAVYAYPAEDYGNMRLFLAEDGKAGFALKPDGDIVSVFGRGQGDQIMLLATQLGGKKLDAFDTILGDLYGRHGFVAVSRIRWNDEYAPENWDKQSFAGWNGGEPDVILMAYDPTYSGKYSEKDGKYYADFDQAAAAQRRAVLAVRRGKPLTKGNPLSSSEKTKEESDDVVFSNRSNVPTPVKMRARQTLIALSKFDGFFQTPRSSAKSMQDIAADINPEIEVKTSRDGQHWTIIMEDGSKANVNTDHDGKIYVDASGLEAGKSRGSELYSIIGAFAYNNGLVFKGDPDGLSKMAMIRRTEQMLSSALKYGTTRHLEPHPLQNIDWIEGDDLGNLDRLIEKSYLNAVEGNAEAGYAPIKELEDIQFNFNTRRFERIDSGEAFTNEDFDRLSGLAKSRLEKSTSNSPGGARPSAPGRTTLKRAALLASLLRKTRGGSAGIGRGSRGTPVLVEPAGISGTGGLDSLPDDLAGVVYSNRKNILGETPLATWTAPKSTPIDNLIYTMQDKLVDTKRVQETISSAQRLIADEWNPYQKELLYHGRTAKQTDDFLSQEIRPLFNAMEEQGVSMDELEEYLQNRHAEERNEQVASINPGMSDGGSGIKTQDARDYLRMLPPEKAEKLEDLAAQVDAISKGTRDLLVKTGLETQATVDAWQGAYKHYVPLQREELEVAPKGQGTGQGMSIRGSSSKRATGSTRKVVDILANLMMQRERAIVRSEKNKVATALYGLAIQNENSSFWLPVNPDAIKNPDQVVQDLLNMGLDQADIDGIMAEPTETVVDSQTGLVVHRINPRLRSMDNVLATRINGKDRFLFFSKEDERAVRMVAALKNLDEDRLGTILTNFRKVTRWMSAINTQYNPIFGIVNLARDVQGGMLNLTSTPLAGKQLAVLSNVGPALKGIYSDLRADRKGKPRSSSAWSTLWEEYQGVGGRTGYRDAYKDSADRAEALRKEIKRIQEGTLKRFGRGIFDWLSDYNDTLENAIRLSAYKVAKDNGISKDQAAALAKNLTVNFNKKGQIASQAGSLYAFFNAGVQGNFRLAQTLSGSAGKKILAGGLILGSAQAILLAAAGYDDDEPPEFTRERNLIIPVGGSKYVTIPLPLGFHVIPNTSRILTELVLNKGKDSGDKLISLLASYADAFDPMGFSGFSYQTLSPTATDPLVALAENRNSFGREIAKEDRSSLDPSPGFTRMKDTATGFSKIAAYVINRMSGGTDYKAGAASPTPDQIDFLIGQATGGVGREVQKTAQFVSSTISGEDIPPHKIPLAGRFYGDTKSQSSETARFYKNLKELNAHEREIKGRIKDGKDVKAYEAEHPEAAMVSAANAVEKMLTNLKTRKRIMIAKGASRSEVKALEGEIASRIKKFNDDVKARSQK